MAKLAKNKKGALYYSAVKTFMSSKKNLYFSIGILFASIFGIYFRLKGLPGEMYFYGDQGQDLLVALRIIRGEFLPQVGPILTLKNFFIPPTYYYFLAALLLIFKSETYLIIVFAVMNIVAGIFLTLYIQKKSGFITSSLFYILFMVLDSSKMQARSLWQPFPVTFFVACGLLLAEMKNRKYLNVLLSIVLFTIALTIYPGSFLLLPVILQNIFLAFRKKMSKRIALINTVFCTGTILLVICLPWIFHEVSFNFPSVSAVVNPDSYIGGYNSKFLLFDSPLGYFQRVFTHLLAIFRLIIPDSWPTPYQRILDLIFLVSYSLLLLLIVYDKLLLLKLKRFLSSIGLSFLLIGITPLLFFESIMLPHHVLVLMPFLIFILAYLINLGIESKKTFQLALGIILFIDLVIANISFILPNNYKKQTYNQVISLFDYLVKDTNNLGNGLNDYDIRMATYSSNGNYEAQALWYILKKNINYPVKFTNDGNDTDRVNEPSDDFHFAYLICFPANEYKRWCWDKYSSIYSVSNIIKYNKHDPYLIYLVKQ